MVGRTRTYAGLWLVVWTLGSGVAGAEQPTAKPVSQATIDALVRQLGDSAFQRREEATKELAHIGLPARPALLAARDDRDAEIRDRVRRILVSVDRADLERRIAEFLADTEGKREHDLPGWKRFRDSVGSDRAAHELFVSMLRAETELLSALDGDQKQLQRVFLNRVHSLQVKQFMPRVDNNNNRQPISSETMAALIFVGSDSNVTIADNVAAVMHTLLHQSSFFKPSEINKGESPTRSLLRLWIMRGTDGLAAQYGLSLAMQHNLREEGLALAEKIITQPGGVGSSPQTAMMVISRFGSAKHVRILEPLLTNKTVVWTIKQKQQEISAQVRDMSLAVLVSLTGQDHAEYGFQAMQKNLKLKDNITAIGFHDDAQREAAATKWRTWKAAQPAEQK